MPQDSTKEPFFGFMAYPGDWLAFLAAPYSFLKATEPGLRADQKRALEYFFLGLTGTIAFSTLNLSFSGSYSTENLATLKSEIVNVGLLLGGATTAIVGGVLSALMGGRRNLRDIVVTFGFTLGFVWPTMTVALIVISRASSAALGYDWTALPPFDTPIRGYAPPTALNVAWTALFAALLMWTAGYLLYCYAAAFRASQGVSLWKALLAASLAVVITSVLNPWLVAVAEAIGERFGPLIEWLLRII